MKFKILSISILSVLLFACKENKKDATIIKKEKSIMEYKHTFSNLNDVKTKHLTLQLRADFEKKILNGSATFKIENLTASDKLILDAKNLNITSVLLDSKEETKFSLSKEDSIFGSALTINIKPETKSVKINYSTNPNSEAVQWLNPQQTAGKTHPFLFTQGEAILTRTWIPCQDDPSNKITYDARIETPLDLMAVMSAKMFSFSNNNLGVYNFKLDKPIPTYLIALAIGNLEFKSISGRTGVFAEPSVIELARSEFEDTENMLVAAENLYGKYEWDRYDVIVLPPSFPFGGMENPMLTFATPTILAGDKSLTSLIAHEMAHSWSGNLVTNATWDDFWLNEGFTVYFERRIMEELYGKDYVDMLAILGKQDLDNELIGLKEDDLWEDTKLKLNLKGRNPDDGMTDIAYEKGAHLLTLIEQKAGRENFDKFLTNYFSENAFKAITTEDFIAQLDSNLLKPNNIEVDYKTWIYKVGLPDNCPIVSSTRFSNVENQIKLAINVSEVDTEKWTTHDWLHFLRNLPDSISMQNMTNLDSKFGFTNSTNSEIAAAWFEHVINNKYEIAYSKMEEFLIKVGRRKFLTPLYSKMKDNNMGELALSIYTKARSNYHSVSTNTIDELLNYK